MSNSDIKEKIIQLLDQTEDQEVLSEVYAHLASHSGVVELSPGLLSQVREMAIISRKQIAQGNCSTSDEVLRKIREKYNL